MLALNLSELLELFLKIRKLVGYKLGIGISNLRLNLLLLVMLHLILLKSTLIDTVLHLDLVASLSDTLRLLLHFYASLMHLRLGFIRFVLIFHCVNQF